MLKNQIEDISFSCIRNGKVLFYLKVSKGGELTRNGFGQESDLDVVLEMHKNAEVVFEEIYSQIPEEFSRLVLTPQKVAENETEYTLVFGGGAKKKNEFGELSREYINGIRITHQQFNGYKHPLMPAVEQLFRHAERTTNTYYFDAVINHAFQTKSNTFREDVSINGPLAFSEKQQIMNDFTSYLKELGQFNSLIKSAADNIYTDENGSRYKIEKQVKNLQINLFLIPVSESLDSPLSVGSSSNGDNVIPNKIEHGFAARIIEFFTSIKTVLFVLMLVLIIYLTFYL